MGIEMLEEHILEHILEYDIDICPDLHERLKIIIRTAASQHRRLVFDMGRLARYSLEPGLKWWAKECHTIIHFNKVWELRDIRIREYKALKEYHKVRKKTILDYC